MAPEQKPSQPGFTAHLLQTSFNFVFLTLSLERESKLIFVLEGVFKEKEK